MLSCIDFGNDTVSNMLENKVTTLECNAGTSCASENEWMAEETLLVKTTKYQTKGEIKL
jgi:hypothetical protein